MVSAPDRQECRANEAGSAIPTLPGWSPRYAEGHNDQHLNVPAQMHSAAQSPRQRGSRQGVRACGGAGSVPSPSPVSGGRARRLGHCQLCPPVAPASSGFSVHRLPLRITRLLDVTCHPGRGLFVPISQRAQPRIPKPGSVNSQFGGLANMRSDSDFPRLISSDRDPVWEQRRGFYLSIAS